MFTFTLMTTETSSQNINKSRPILHWLQDLFSLDTCTDIITYLLQRGNITVTSISGSGSSASTIDCAEWSRFSIFDINSDCTDFNLLTSSSEPWKEEMLGEAINPQMNKEFVAIDIHHPEYQRQWQYHQHDWVPLWRVYSNFRCLRYTLQVFQSSSFLQLERECHHNNQ